MKNLRHWLPAALILLLGGCHTAAPPAVELLSDTYGPANREATDRMLAGLKELKLRDAQEIAVLNNQNYLAAGQAVYAAKMRYYQSLGAFLPQITAGTDAGQHLNWHNHLENQLMDEPGRRYNFTSMTNVTASWLLFDGLGREFAMLARESGFRREMAMEMKTKCMLRRAVAYAYFDWQLAAEIDRIQQDNRQFQQTMRQEAETGFEAGRRVRDEVLNFQLQQGFAQTDIIQARYQQEIAGYALAQLMGYAEGRLPAHLELTGLEGNLRPIPYSADLCLDIALHNSPIMHIMEETLKMAEYEKYRSYSAFSPQIYAYSQFDYAASSSRYQDFRFDRNYYDGPGVSYGVRAEWMIFNGFARYNAMREQQAAYAATRYRMAETYLEIVNDILAGYAWYQSCLEQAKVYRELLAAAREQRELVVERYRQRDESVDRVDRAQSNLIQAQTRYAELVTNMKKAVAQLEAIMMIDIFE
ncbi:TolC family protein [Victivallis sp. Marseille-Q1083]|uniref:TolC family protein n=1 Tax=Victivallis sp. Marseille-Q1083 TaxID=2717288 RepID=UPI00158A9D79|nr:TolC family protein [Victivallis sp. Marseille-Q1083]